MEEGGRELLGSVHMIAVLLEVVLERKYIGKGKLVLKKTGEFGSIQYNHYPKSGRAEI